MSMELEMKKKKERKKRKKVKNDYIPETQYFPITHFLVTAASWFRVLSCDTSDTHLKKKGKIDGGRKKRKKIHKRQVNEHPR